MDTPNEFKLMFIFYTFIYLQYYSLIYYHYYYLKRTHLHDAVTEMAVNTITVINIPT